MARRATTAAAERRATARVAVLIDVEVDPGCDGTYLFARATELNADGLFVRCAAPELPGTAIRLRVPCDDGATLELEGEVAWCNPAGPRAIDPGMGVRFVDGQPVERAQLASLIGRIAYLDLADDAVADNIAADDVERD